MLIRRVAGFVGLAVSGWLYWEALRAVLFVMDRGSDLASALFDPPLTAIRLTATALMILGSILAVLAVRGGAWLFTTGAVIFAIMVALMVGLGADYTLWRDEAVLGTFLLVISGVLVFCNRN